MIKLLSILIMLSLVSSCLNLKAKEKDKDYLSELYNKVEELQCRSNEVTSKFEEYLQTMDSLNISVSYSPLKLITVNFSKRLILCETLTIINDKKTNKFLFSRTFYLVIDRLESTLKIYPIKDDKGTDKLIKESI